MRFYDVTSWSYVNLDDPVEGSGRRYACTSTEESSRLRASASLRV